MKVAERDALALQRTTPAGTGLRGLTTDTGAIAASAYRSPGEQLKQPQLNFKEGIIIP